MRRFFSIALSILIWFSIIAYFAVTVTLVRRQRANIIVREVRIIVEDSSEKNIVTSGMIAERIERAGLDFRNMDIDAVNTQNIRDLVENHLFVQQARVYKTLKGEIVIKVTQRLPILRVSLNNGYNFYVTDDEYVFPVQSRQALRLPIVTGSFTPPFERGYAGKITPPAEDAERSRKKSYEFLINLINFVKFVEASAIWSSQIEQINVVDRGAGSVLDPKVEIVPRVGNHVVVLGSLEDYREKLDRLMFFYRQALDYEGWDKYRIIDLSFEGQVVGR